MSERPTEALRKRIDAYDAKESPLQQTIGKADMYAEADALDARIADLERRLAFAESLAQENLKVGQMELDACAEQLATVTAERDRKDARIAELERLVARMLPFYGEEPRGDKIDEYEAVLELANAALSKKGYDHEPVKPARQDGGA